MTLPKRALDRRIGVLSGRKLDQLDDALRFALGLEADGLEAAVRREHVQVGLRSHHQLLHQGWTRLRDRRQ